MSPPPIRLTQSYLQLPEAFYYRLTPDIYFRGPTDRLGFTPAIPGGPVQVLFNQKLARQLGLGVPDISEYTEFSAELLAQLAGMDTQEMHPLAQAYAGHQFGHLNMLGDGRALLLGEVSLPVARTDITLHPVQQYDIQLKGSGRTPFSRSGDGRAALAPMLREYVISEAMYALGVPTTRSLGVMETGETVMREQPEKGAILTRVAGSHIRVGTFVYAAHLPGIEPLMALADFTIARHYPWLTGQAGRYRQLLVAVVSRQAALVARWMALGFVHGVMNTDNMSMGGESIDYGPCAFIDTFSQGAVFSSIDRNGRYAYRQQPQIAAWNLARLAEALLPLIMLELREAGQPLTEKLLEKEAVVIATAILEGFQPAYGREWLHQFGLKLGLPGLEPPVIQGTPVGNLPEAGQLPEDHNDRQLIQQLLTLMETHAADFTLTFSDLGSMLKQQLHPTVYAVQASAAQQALLMSPDFSKWFAEWQQRLGDNRQEAPSLMQQHNPRRIPRNFRVEEALFAASRRGDYGPLHRLLAALQDPWTEDESHVWLERPPENGGAGYRTFCGT